MSTERAVLERLQHLDIEAAHPLLLPGILAELELIRHAQIVDTCVSEVEAKVLELNIQSDSVYRPPASEVELHNLAKRTAWLDLVFLRNSLITWRTQLLKLPDHIDRLILEDCFAFESSGDGSAAKVSSAILASPTQQTKELDRVAMGEEEEFESSQALEDINTMPSVEQRRHYSEKGTIPRPGKLGLPASSDSSMTLCPPYGDEAFHVKQMKKTSEKITARINAIVEEYDEKIRECTMRVDGMAMATQWVTTTA